MRAGFQLDFKPTSPRSRAKGPIMQDRLSPFGIPRLDHLGVGESGDLADMVHPCPLGRLDDARHARPICLFHVPLLELGGQTPGGLLIQAEDHRPRHGPVEPVWNAQIRLVGRSCSWPQERLNPDLQAIDARRSLSQHARRLVDRQAWAVFVEDLESEKGVH